MLPRFYQIDAIQGAIHGHFTLRTAANRAYIATYARTETTRLARIADFAFHDGRTGPFHRNIGVERSI
jgi:hypothetical protein